MTTDEPSVSEGADEDMPPLDIPTLLASTHRGSAMAREIAGRRPARANVGRQLALVVDLLEAAIGIGRTEGTGDDIAHRPADDEELENRYYWNPWMPKSGSPCRVEIAELQGAGWEDDIVHHEPEEDFGRPLLLSRRLMEAALDHVRGIAVLFQAEGVTRSPIAVARVALEGAVRTWYLLDPAIDARQRHWRAINAELDALTEEVSAARREHDDECMRESGREISTLLARCVQLGATRDSKNGQRLEPYKRASAIVDLLMEQTDGSTYHGLSRIVHSQEDEGFRLMFGLNEPAEAHPQRDRMMALNTLPAIISLLEATKRVAWYTGWDLSAVDEVEADVLAMWAAASGLYDEAFEAAIEAEGWNPPPEADPNFWRRLADESDESS